MVKGKGHYTCWGNLMQTYNLTRNKVYELIAEAAPQFLLNCIFIANNFPFIIEKDYMFDNQPIPTSFVSLTFSAVSMSIGIYQGLPILYKEVRDYLLYDDYDD